LSERKTKKDVQNWIGKPSEMIHFFQDVMLYHLACSLWHFKRM